MHPDPLHRHLLKFLLLSAFSFFVGTIHGMLQVMPPIRAWLDSIGSPYGGPGHMIDPLAHAHMNLVGGVVLLAMCYPAIRDWENAFLLLWFSVFE